MPRAMCCLIVLLDWTNVKCNITFIEETDSKPTYLNPWVRHCIFKKSRLTRGSSLTKYTEKYTENLFERIELQRKLNAVHIHD